MHSPTLAIGIDLGTLYSCVSIWQRNRVEIISNHDGNKVTPCCVAFTSTGRLIGDAAKNQIMENPQNTIFGIKSLLGRRFDDPKVIQNAKYRSFYVVNDYGRPKIQVDWKGETMYFAPEEISAMVLITLKNISENYLGTCVKDAVISVPAYFNNSQRQATKDAATIAGLNVLRIISEPTATALAYRFLNKNIEEQKNVLIFDLGGETTEVSIVSISGGSLEIKAVAYDQAFGGKDFDNRLVKHLSNEFKRKFKIDLSPYSVYRLQLAAQKAKHSLSSSQEVEVKINALVDDINFCTKVSRSKFEEVCSDLFSKTLSPVKKALNDAKFAPSSIDDIVLVGGSTRIPKIQNLLQNFFPGKSLNFPTNPEETIAYGAAILAAVLSGDKSVDLHIPVGPMSLADVTPFSLGIGTAGGGISKIINKNTKIPCKQTRTFTTNTDNQCAITLNVYEGERAVSSKNDLLCTFELTEIPPAPFGIPKIDVTFSLDANGILEVTAKENSFQVSKTIVIQNNKGLSREEINRMTAERSKEEYFGIGSQQNIQVEKGAKRKISE